MNKYDTNKFHIIPKSALKKMGINEKESLFKYSFETKKYDSGKFSFCLDLNDEAFKLFPKNKMRDIFIFNNIVEYYWNFLEIENKVFNYMDSIKNEIKNEGKNLIITKNREINPLRSLWNKLKIFNSLKSLTPDYLLSMTFITLQSVMAEDEDIYLKIKKDILINIKNKEFKNFILKGINEHQNWLDEIKPNTEHEFAKSIDSKENDVVAILFKMDQPLHQMIYNKIPPELVNESKWEFVPYGYEVLQLNSKYSLIIIDTISSITKVNKISELFSSINISEFDELSKYLYVNSFQKSFSEVYSHNESELKNFVNKLDDIDCSDSYMQSIYQYDYYLSDFNISSTIRNENFYIPAKKAIENLNLPKEIYSMAFTAAVLQPPISSFCKEKSVKIIENSKLLSNGEISVEEYKKRIEFFYHFSMNFYINILGMDIDVLHDSIIKK